MPIPRSISCSALLISGTVGAGKTSVAEMVGDLLTEAGVANAVIDLDWPRRSWRSPAGDRFNVGMALRNLRSVAGIPGCRHSPDRSGWRHRDPD